MKGKPSIEIDEDLFLFVKLKAAEEELPLLVRDRSTGGVSSEASSARLISGPDFARVKDKLDAIPDEGARRRIEFLFRTGGKYSTCKLLLHPAQELLHKFPDEVTALIKEVARPDMLLAVPNTGRTSR